MYQSHQQRKTISEFVQQAAREDDNRRSTPWQNLINSVKNSNIASTQIPPHRVTTLEQAKWVKDQIINQFYPRNRSDKPRLLDALSRVYPNIGYDDAADKILGRRADFPASTRKDVSIQRNQDRRHIVSAATIRDIVAAADSQKATQSALLEVVKSSLLIHSPKDLYDINFDKRAGFNSILSPNANFQFSQAAWEARNGMRRILTMKKEHINNSPENRSDYTPRENKMMVQAAAFLMNGCVENLFPGNAAENKALSNVQSNLSRALDQCDTFQDLQKLHDNWRKFLNNQRASNRSHNVEEKMKHNTIAFFCERMDHALAEKQTIEIDPIHMDEQLSAAIGKTKDVEILRCECENGHWNIIAVKENKKIFDRTDPGFEKLVKHIQQQHQQNYPNTINSAERLEVQKTESGNPPYIIRDKTTTDSNGFLPMTHIPDSISRQLPGNNKREITPKHSSTADALLTELKNKQNFHNIKGDAEEILFANFTIDLWGGDRKTTEQNFLHLNEGSEGFDLHNYSELTPDKITKLFKWYTNYAVSHPHPPTRHDNIAQLMQERKPDFFPQLDHSSTTAAWNDPSFICDDLKDIPRFLRAHKISTAPTTTAFARKDPNGAITITIPFPHAGKAWNGAAGSFTYPKPQFRIDDGLHLPDGQDVPISLEFMNKGEEFTAIHPAEQTVTSPPLGGLPLPPTPMYQHGPTPVTYNTPLENSPNWAVNIASPPLTSQSPYAVGTPNAFSPDALHAATPGSFTPSAVQETPMPDDSSLEETLLKDRGFDARIFKQLKKILNNEAQGAIDKGATMLLQASLSDPDVKPSDLTSAEWEAIPNKLKFLTNFEEWGARIDKYPTVTPSVKNSMKTQMSKLQELLEIQPAKILQTQMFSANGEACIVKTHDNNRDSFTVKGPQDAISDIFASNKKTSIIDLMEKRPKDQVCSWAYDPSKGYIRQDDAITSKALHDGITGFPLYDGKNLLIYTPDKTIYATKSMRTEQVMQGTSRLVRIPPSQTIKAKRTHSALSEFEVQPTHPFSATQSAYDSMAWFSENFDVAFNFDGSDNVLTYMKEQEVLETLHDHPVPSGKISKFTLQDNEKHSPSYEDNNGQEIRGLAFMNSKNLYIYTPDREIFVIPRNNIENFKDLAFEIELKQHICEYGGRDYKGTVRFEDGKITCIHGNDFLDSFNSKNIPKDDPWFKKIEQHRNRMNVDLKEKDVDVETFGQFVQEWRESVPPHFKLTVSKTASDPIKALSGLFPKREIYLKKTHDNNYDIIPKGSVIHRSNKHTHRQEPLFFKAVDSFYGQERHDRFIIDQDKDDISIIPYGANTKHSIMKVKKHELFSYKDFQQELFPYRDFLAEKIREKSVYPIRNDNVEGADTQIPQLSAALDDFWEKKRKDPIYCRNNIQYVSAAKIIAESLKSKGKDFSDPDKTKNALKNIFATWLKNINTAGDRLALLCDFASFSYVDEKEGKKVRYRLPNAVKDAILGGEWTTASARHDHVKSWPFVVPIRDTDPQPTVLASKIAPEWAYSVAALRKNLPLPTTSNSSDPRDGEPGTSHKPGDNLNPRNPRSR